MRELDKNSPKSQTNVTEKTNASVPKILAVINLPKINKNEILNK